MDGMNTERPTKRALLLWADQSAANLGLRVLATGGAQLARTASRHALDVDNQDFGPGDSTISFGTKSILRDIGRRSGPIKSKLRQYDVLLDSGAGDSFTDIYGLKRLSFIAYAHYQARRLGIPLILLPQTIGPFNTRLGRHIGRKSLRQALVILVRDPRSAKYCYELAKRSPDATSTDVVFALDQEMPDSPRDVVINISGLLWFADDHVDSGFYRRESIDLIERCLRSGRSVALLAHVVRSPSGNDDIDAITALLEQHPDLKGKIEFLVPSDLQEARRFLASAQVVIGARMHACLNALSQGVPAIPWAYSRKFAPLLAALGWNRTVQLSDCADPSIQTMNALNEDPSALRSEAGAVVTRARQLLMSTVSVLNQHL